MAISESPIPAGAVTTLNQLMHAQRNTAVATLTAAIVTAANRPHSIAEVLEINRSIYFSMFPEAGSGAYQAWVKDKDQELTKVRG